jgi:hypothetical protein
MADYFTLVVPGRWGLRGEVIWGNHKLWTTAHQYLTNTSDE